ncbi:MAG: 30S ribosome-binding factor RbfA [Magnetococcales bacterium]|nr:30S ribosome-binding factor RbfA [Magnetococcales bacterium]
MSVRVDRVRGEIRKELAAMLQRGDIHDPKVAMSLISITDVTLSRDLHYAVVHFTAMGQELAEVHSGLRRAAGFMRARVGRALGLRLAPELRFEPDLSFKRAEQIESLLKTIDIPSADGGELRPGSGA